MIRALIATAALLHFTPMVLATIPPMNDQCINATNVTSTLHKMLPYNGKVNTRYATTDFSSGTCSIMSTDIGVWYTLIGNNQNIEVDVARLGNRMTPDRNGIEVAVFVGTCNNLKCLKSVTDFTENPMVNLSWNATIGQEYYIIVAGTSASTGMYSLNIEVCIIQTFFILHYFICTDLTLDF
jgi:hypothetical protein